MIELMIYFNDIDDSIIIYNLNINDIIYFIFIFIN
jgi:hypothetical protein